MTIVHELNIVKFNVVTRVVDTRVLDIGIKFSVIDISTNVSSQWSKTH